MSEFDLIEQIRAAGLVSQPDTLLGIGDDAALLQPPPGMDLVACVDTLVSGVHYPVDSDAADIGYKALAVNLSDLAAMGAEPRWATLALTLKQHDRPWIAAFMEGFAAAATPAGVDLVGGDTTQGPEVVTVQALGLVPTGTAMTRDGAGVGDSIIVTGTLGDAALALRRLQRNEPVSQFLLNRLNRPTARVAAGLKVRELATAAIDISDGLAQDLNHILRASAVGATVRVDSLPASEEVVRTDVVLRQQLQLSGGDDYELCFTVPQDKVQAALAVLGELGCGGQIVGTTTSLPGLRFESEDGTPVVPAIDSGYEHFQQ